ASNAPALELNSPDGRLSLVVTMTDEGAPRYRVTRDKQPVLDESRLGLVRDDADFSRDLRVQGVSDVRRISEDYEILTAKRRRNHYEANERVLSLTGASERRMDVIFRLSNDGFAFRYRFPETDATVRRVTDEATTFRFPADTRGWLQPMAPAKTGWQSTNPSYEEFYEDEIRAGMPSPMGAGWIYPALFRSGDTWLLVSESDLSRANCATRLQALSPEPEYKIAFPDPREGRGDGAVSPES